MKKLVKELEIGDSVELLNNSIGIVSEVLINKEENKATIIYDNGMKTYALPNEEIEIL